MDLKITLFIGNQGFREEADMETEVHEGFRFEVHKISSAQNPAQGCFEPRAATEGIESYCFLKSFL